MVKIVEWSNDGITWSPIKTVATLIPNMLRETENLSGKTNEELRGVISKYKSKQLSKRENDIHRIEYSMDGGFSWQEFKILGNQLDPIAANIYRLANTTKGYSVRTLDVIDNRTEPSTRSFKKFTRTEPNVKTDESFIMRQGNHYTWVNNLFDGTANAMEHVSSVRLDIPFRMNIPNSNHIFWTKWTGECTEWNFDAMPAKEAMNAANMGHVYKIRHAREFQGTFMNLISTDLAAKLNFSPKEWSVVQSARLYDAESEAIFGTVDKITFLSGKYIVGNSQKEKLGAQFFIRNSDIWEVYTAAQIIGAYVEIEQAKEIHEQAVMNDNTQIRRYKSFLENLLASATTPQELSTAIGAAVDYRDKTVDELKQLNTTIINAKEKLLRETMNSEIGSDNESDPSSTTANNSNRR